MGIWLLVQLFAAGGAENVIQIGFLAAVGAKESSHDPRILLLYGVAFTVPQHRFAVRTVNKPIREPPAESQFIVLIHHFPAALPAGSVVG